MKINALNHRDHRGRRGKTFFSLTSLCSLCPLWLILVFVSACIPAQTPPVLNAAPAAGAIITRDSYRNDLFSVAYPTGWRVITSPVGSPPSVTLVAPGNCALIVVSSAPLGQPPTSPSCDQPDVKTFSRDVALGSQQIVIAGSAPAAGWDEFLATVDRVAASLKTAS